MASLPSGAGAEDGVKVPVCAAPTGAPTARVVAVPAGDTIRLDDGRRVRLSEIEIPRSGSRGGAKGLADLVLGGPVVVLAVAEPDRYGRIEANVFGADGASIGAILVGLGGAMVTPKAGNPCRTALLKAEAAARGARRGLWADPDRAVRNADDPSLSSRNGLYEIVEGRVLSVGRGTRMVFLDFGRDFSRDFSVFIPLPVASQFESDGQRLDGLAGRRVRVRGVVEENGGPVIRLEDAGEIEFVDEDESDVGGAKN